MRKKSIKNICSIPFLFRSVFKTTELILGKSSGGYILCWHDLSANKFKSHVEALYPSKPIPLYELVERYKAGKSIKNCFSITFDDGVGKTVRDISAVCNIKEWPVTFYIPTGYLGGDFLPYQKIEFINKFLPQDNYFMPTSKQKVSKKKLIQSLTKLLYIKHYKDVDKIIDHFINQVVIRTKNNLSNSMLPTSVTWNEIENLSKNPLISFQSHSVTHSAVSSLNEDEIEYEMLKSKTIIEEHTEKKVHSFCYPYGSERSIGNLAPKIAAKHFNSAATLIRGRLKDSNPFYLPRIDFNEDDTIGFARLKVALT